jgi:hypothetical protein
MINVKIYGYEHVSMLNFKPKFNDNFKNNFEGCCLLMRIKSHD